MCLPGSSLGGKGAGVGSECRWTLGTFRFEKVSACHLGRRDEPLSDLSQELLLMQRSFRGGTSGRCHNATESHSIVHERQQLPDLEKLSQRVGVTSPPFGTSLALNLPTNLLQPL
jgi:hypothetical protein